MNTQVVIVVHKILPGLKKTLNSIIKLNQSFLQVYLQIDL